MSVRIGQGGDGSGGGSGNIESLNGLTDPNQVFLTGTTGVDFNIDSTSPNHTFNIPDASSTARGLVTTGNQSFDGEKTFLDPVTIDVTTDQNTPVFNFGNSTGDAKVYVHTATPEGAIAANVGSICTNLTNGKLYVKRSGTGTTGWKPNLTQAFFNSNRIAAAVDDGSAFVSINGDSFSTVSADVALEIAELKVTQMRVSIATNTMSDDTLIRLFRSGSSAAVLTVPAASTGLITLDIDEDYADGDTIYYRIAIGAGSLAGETMDITSIALIYEGQ